MLLYTILTICVIFHSVDGAPITTAVDYSMQGDPVITLLDYSTHHNNVYPVNIPYRVIHEETLKAQDFDI